MADKWDWKLQLPNGDFTFGDDYSTWVVERWDVSEARLRTDDIATPRGDGVMMGQDFREPPTLSFDLWSHVNNEDDARLALTDLIRRWDASDVRSRGGMVVRLTHPRGRSVFGRPRKIAPTNINRIERGRAQVTAEFDAVFDSWFGESWSAVVPLVPPLGRGLVAPLVEPLTIQGVALNAAGFVVPGQSASYPIIEFRGPITNPSLHADGWVLRVRGSLAHDDVLRVDTRPWVRSLSLNGRPVAGMLMPSSSRLRDVVLEPGFHSVQLRGTDITGTASVDISGEATYASF